MSLVIVPCHSIWKSAVNDTNPLDLGQSPGHWILAPFQFEGRDHLAMIKHGLQAFLTLIDEFENADENNGNKQSLLLFSGSKTKSQIDMSEGESYYKLIHKILSYKEKENKPLIEIFQDSNLVELIQDIKAKFSNEQELSSFFNQHVSFEEYALDSFDNLYYSLLKYQELYNNYPMKTTVIGFEFKRERFVELHGLKALGLQLQYIGIDPEPFDMTLEQMDSYFKDLSFQENKNALQLFKNDWYAVRHPLIDKKLSRNPFNMVPIYKQLIELTHSEDTPDSLFFETVVEKKYNHFANIAFE